MHFLKLEWFPGWQEHGNYNRQPNDDGLSEQDCVEIRRFYHRPSTSGISSTTTSLTESFMWNDRDCATRNFFLCERPLIDGKGNNVVICIFCHAIFLLLLSIRLCITKPYINFIKNILFFGESQWNLKNELLAEKKGSCNIFFLK